MSLGGAGAPLRVVVLGPGRLGRSLAVLLPRAGHQVTLWARGAPIPAADLYFLTVRDDALAEVAALLPDTTPRLHASGTRSYAELGPTGERGVLHPLMTFPGPEIGLPPLQGVGAGVAGTPGALALANRLALDLGLLPFPIPADPRRYHAAAVIAGNHASALLLSAAELLVGPGLSIEEARARLLPLAMESLRQVAAGGPAAITGPTARGDHQTEQGHLAVIGEERRVLYEAAVETIHRLRGDPVERGG